MKHQYFKGIFLCLCLFTCINTFAYDAKIDGIYYNFSGDEATVTYATTSYNSYSGAVVIPESVTYNDKTYIVTSIGEGAFRNCSGLTSITIPNTVTSIGGEAFRWCDGLTSITIPNSVTSIGENAFVGCYFASSSFVNNSSLTSDNNWGAVICDEETIDGLLIKDNIVVEARPWVYSVTIPESVTSIGDAAFYSCEGLYSVTIPESVTSIGEEAFSYCSSLTSITIPNSVTSIGEEAFSDCSSLTSITIPNSVTSISYGVFGGCSSLTSITIPNSVTSIGNYAFYNCTSLTSVTISEGVTSIGNGAFYDCTSLTSVTISEGVTSIGKCAFENCSSLTSITIPNSVTSIGEDAFSDCSSLTSVNMDIDTPLAITENTFSNRTNATLIVPNGCMSAYKAANYWKEFKYILEGPNAITIGSSGYGTFCSSQPMDLTDISAFKAYIVSGFNPETSTLVLTRVTEVPAGEGLYIVGTPGTYDVPSKATAMIYSNLLIGVTTATTISPTDGSYTNFILANGEHGVAFYSLSEAGELAAGKAYLQLPTASVPEVKAIRVIFDDDEDAIQSIAEESQTERIYNLQGQQVNAPKSGLYIVNGKKVFIK